MYIFLIKKTWKNYKIKTNETSLKFIKIEKKHS